MRSLRHGLSWLLASLVIALVLHITIHPLPDPATGGVLLYDLPGENVFFATLAERSGYPIFEPGARVVAGLALLVISLLIFLPWTRRTGGLLSFFLFAAALGAHLSPWLGRELPIAMGDVQTGLDNGRHFTLMLVLLVSSLLVMIVHPGRKRREH